MPLSRDYSASRFWMEAVRDLGADAEAIFWLERFDLVNRAILSVVSNLYPLLINDYFRFATVTETSGEIDLDAQGIRVMKGANVGKIALQSSVLDNKAAIPLSLEAHLAFSPSAIQNAKSIVYVYAGNKVLVKRGSSLSSFGALTLWYPAIPSTVAADATLVDLPDGGPIALGILVLKKILAERLKLPDHGYGLDLEVGIKNLYQSYGIVASKEILKEKVEAFG